MELSVYKIKPCHLCLSKHVTYSEVKPEDYLNHKWQITCESCGYTIRYNDTLDQAVVFWNLDSDNKINKVRQKNNCPSCCFSNSIIETDNHYICKICSFVIDEILKPDFIGWD